MTNQRRRQYTQSQGLNLSHQRTNAAVTSVTASASPSSSSAAAISSNQYRTNNEVGLNLSLQNGMNLSNNRHNSGESTNGEQQQQQQQSYYYTSSMSNGYINLSTQKYPSTGNGASASYNKTGSSNFQANVSSDKSANQRNNSPLNLTAHQKNLTVVQQGTDNAGRQKFQSQNSFSDLRQPQQQQQFYQECSYGYVTDMSQSSYQQPQQQQQQQPQQQGYSGDGASGDGFYAFNNQGQVDFGNNGYHTGIQSNASSAGTATTTTTSKIRLMCASCCQEFSTTSELNRHMEKHTQEMDASSNNSRLFFCSTCGVQTKDQQALCSHMSRSHGVKDNWNASSCQQQPQIIQQQQPFNRTTTYSDCNFANSQDLSSGATSRHTMVPVSNQEVAIPSDMSSATTAAPPPPGLTNNSTSKTEDIPESCLDCSMTFSSGLDLRKHIDLAHKGRQTDMRYQCLHCAQEFPDKPSHKAHVELHLKEKPFKCNKCGMHLSSQAVMNRHIKRVHGNKENLFQCEECGKRFYERYDLHKHVKRHLRNSGLPKCGTCGKTFSDEKLKEKHKCKVKVRNGPGFPCEICESVLDSKVLWGVHMWKHTKDSKYIIPAEMPPSQDDGKTKETETTSTGASSQPLCLQKKDAPTTMAQKQVGMVSV